MAGTSFFPFFKKAGYDLAGVASAAVILTHMNSINSDVITIKDSKTCGDDLAVFCDGSADCFFQDSAIHGWNNGSVDRVCGSFQIKQAADPEIRNFIGKKNVCDRCIQNCFVQIYRHNIGYVLDGVAAVFQHIVEIRRYKRADLEDGRCSKTFINIFTVGDFFPPGKGGGSELLHTVSSVCIKIRKTEDPAIVKLHFVRWPGVQRHILDFFDCCFHIYNLSVSDE